MQFLRDDTVAARTSGVLFAVLAAQFLTLTMLSAAIAPSYDFHTSAISDLGVIAETEAVFNGSLVSVGVLNAVAGYGFWRMYRSRWLLAVSLLASAGAAGAGVFPLDGYEVHGLFALAAFLGFNVQAIGMARRLRGPNRVLGIAAGMLGFAFVVIMVIGDSGNEAIFGAIGHGGAERMIAYPPMLWLISAGGSLMSRTDRT